MRTFKHVRLEERELFFLWKGQGVSLREIGRRLGRSHTTFVREPKRNAKFGQPYLPYLADRKAKKRAHKQRYRAPLKNPRVFLYVRTRLRDWEWSPETIAGRLPIDHPGYAIDDETIYRYVYGRKQKKMKLWEHLVCHRRKRMRKNGRKVKAYGRFPEAIPIDKRPVIITQRQQPGHWETDNMEGKRSDGSAVSVTVERMTRVTRIRKLTDHTAQTKADALIVQFYKEHPLFRESLTIDRGAENTSHTLVTDLYTMPVFACNAYHSWEKGTVENTIGRIRRYIPKGNSVDGVSQEKLNRIEETLNNTPRKVLGYLTPNEYLEKILSASYIS